MKLDALPMIKFTTLVLIIANMVGCVAITVPPPSASADTLIMLRMAKLKPASVGEFGVSTDVDPRIDTRLSGLRGSSIQPTHDGFSQQLRDVITTELQAAGLFDKQSDIEIKAELTDNQVNAAISEGTAKLAAKFIVLKAGNKIFEKHLSVESNWDSSFIGAIAIPKAMDEYLALYQKLAAKLFADSDFQATLAK